MRSRRKSRWESESVKRLLLSLEEKDPIVAIVNRSRRLIAQASMTGPPFDPEKLAEFQGVRLPIRRVQMALDGRLVPEPDGLIIEVRADHPETKRRFTCAHEIGHTFFFECNGGVPAEKGDHNIGSYGIEQEEEYLCDKAAAELLMPEPIFRRLAYRLSENEFGASIALLYALAKEFRVSLSAAAVRLAEVSLWKSVFVVLDPAEGAAQVPELKVAWAARSASVQSFLPRYLRLDRDSGILRTLERGERTYGRERLSLGGVPGDYYVESARIGSRGNWRVLSLIMLERNAESFARPSSLPIMYAQWPLL